MIKVGITKFKDDRWMSVSKTYDFYRRALAGSFDLVEIAQEDIVSASHHVDAIVNFKGSRAFLEREEIVCPVLYGMHGGLVVDHSFVSANLPKLRTCDALLVNCTSDNAIVQSWFSGQLPKIIQLPLPVNTASELQNLQGGCRKMLGIEEADVVLGFVARLLPAKNLHGFLRMLAQVQRALYPARVRALIVGSYWVDYPILGYCTIDYRHYINQLIDDLGVSDSLIYFPASLTSDDLRIVYAAMDVLLHPTFGIDENFGYVAVEAMGQGVPVVAAAYGGLKDTIKVGVTGHLMATWATSGGIRMDVKAGVAYTTELLAQPARRAVMAEAAWLHTGQLFSETSCAQTLVRAVREAISTATGCGPVRLHRKMPDEPFYPRSSILPDIEKGWFNFDHAVAHYVSAQLPQLCHGDILTLAAPVSWRDQIAHLDEPAWPISEAMDDKIEAFLAMLGHSSCEVGGADWPFGEIAQTLVTKGWLSVHRPKGMAF
ncbi:glycosyltransferase family 4 protein [Rhizobium laguerreae]|uniref:glycosyltransferase family 4 protein n=1 Tax=Rhizobium laguerreae TaxID=1076926 RepID=UPI001C902633|nr:glycosyltransferase family 4 protein [Rhizobium laguerreae]MBY3222200.1 glycosyltransferase family 4 protein [Rhizobium laguerreae]